MKKVAFGSLFALPVVAMAHAGHGPVNDGLVHYLLSPLHLSALLTAGVIGVCMYLYVRNRKRKNA